MANEDKRVEINPGEVFLVSKNTVLAESYESCFAMTGKIGFETDQPAYLMTFEGRMNNTQDRESVTIILSVIDAWNFCSTMLDQFEWLRKTNSDEDSNQTE